MWTYFQKGLWYWKSIWNPSLDCNQFVNHENFWSHLRRDHLLIERRIPRQFTFSTKYKLGSKGFLNIPNIKFILKNGIIFITEFIKTTFQALNAVPNRIGKLFWLTYTSSGPTTSWEIDGETVSDLIFWGSKITADGDCSHEIKRRLLLGRKVMTNLVQFSSVTQSCLTLCNPMNRSTPGLPVHHQLPESTQTHVHWVGDAIQPSHLLSSPSPPALNLSQHQGLFKWISSSHQVAKV